jgi:hypothetical protein
MISRLASPSVCVIDDEEGDFRPILAALNSLYVSSIHILGSDIEELPPRPFNGMRLVFLDLHLSGSVGKDAASYTANVFRRVVSSDTAPIVVVIWSKYAKDRVAQDGIPPEDQETEAELFKRTVFEAEPKYKGRLIFVEMDKPKPDDRPRGWSKALKAEIRRALKDQSAIDALWAWELLVKEGCNAVSEGLTALAAVSAAAEAIELKDALRETMKRLTKAQGEGDLSKKTAPRHLATVLAQLLLDQLEHPDGLETLAAHGDWLASAPAGQAGERFAQRMNGLLLTAGVPKKSAPFGPGTVYRVTDGKRVVSAFGRETAALVELCWDRRRTIQNEQQWAEWNASVKPVAIELSPECDVAQNHRVTSLLIGGLIVPAAKWTVVPAPIHLRWAADDFPEQDVLLVFCHRFKAALPAKSLPRWLKPWFRLRELPTAAIRNQYSGHAARVGYVSVEG